MHELLLLNRGTLRYTGDESGVRTMVRKLSVAALLLAALALNSCIFFTPGERSEGYLHLVIAPQTVTAEVSPKVLPENAEKIRIRVWNTDPAYNSVTTVALIPGGQEVDIPIPAGKGYTVDVISYLYDIYPLALTGGRSDEVEIKADDMTEVEISLEPWDVTVTGPDEVGSEDVYSIGFAPADPGDLRTKETFDTATLRVSEGDFNDPAVRLPGQTGATVPADGKEIELTAQAPSVEDDTVFYSLALIKFTEDWYDGSLTDPIERSMYLELPNRHMGKALHEFTVKPALGGIVIVISGEK